MRTPEKMSDPTTESQALLPASLAPEGEQALAEYKVSLKFFPNRFDSLYGAGQAAELAHV